MFNTLEFSIDNHNRAALQNLRVLDADVNYLCRSIINRCLLDTKHSVIYNSTDVCLVLCLSVHPYPLAQCPPSLSRLPVCLFLCLPYHLCLHPSLSLSIFLYIPSSMCGCHLSLYPSASLTPSLSVFVRLFCSSESYLKMN